MVIEVETFPRSMPWKSRSMSSTVSIATPTRPTSPRARGLSESWPICVGRSNAVERPVCPEASRYRKRRLVSSAVPNPAYWRIVQSRPRHQQYSAAEQGGGCSLHAFRVRDGVPERGVGSLPEAADLRQRLVHLGRPEQPVPDDAVAGRGEQEVQVLDEGWEGGLAGAGAEEEPGAPGRPRPRFVQERREPASHDGVVAEPIVRAHVRLPERPQSGRLRPEA